MDTPPGLGGRERFGETGLEGEHRGGVWKQHWQKVRQIFGAHFFISLNPPQKFLQRTSRCLGNAEGNVRPGWGVTFQDIPLSTY